MSLIMRDFVCPAGHTFEDLIEQESHNTKCPTCGKTAKAVLSPTPGWCPSPQRTQEQLAIRSHKHSLTPGAVDEARHQYDKAMGKINKKVEKLKG